ncbi:ABC transporter substrate-binding protein [Clostridium sp. C2-6-12]|uniref:ABC transporter substrate-binding protein n=1 Tax=Clostridium sp. C2-6-12 TaxID=2698832 RepID=UPI00137135DC|nr:ABC transporter substrate-binding protein [Clostridium sp. C2-6-12]
MKKKLFYIIILLYVILFFVGFINRESDNMASGNLEEAITYGMEAIPDDLEKVTNLSKRQEDIICAVSKGLVSKDQDNKIIPSLASEVVKDPDGIQYEFKIRDDVFWSDGTKITPKDIVGFFKELLKEEDEKNIQGLLEVYGARKYKEGKVVFENGVAIKGTDSSVIIRLNNKDDNFLNELTNPQYRLRKYLVMWRNIRNNYDTLIYSGDYKISSITKDQFTLKRSSISNDVNISAIKIVTDDSIEESMASYEVSERDIVINPPESELNKLSEGKKLITVPKLDAAYLYINSKGDTIPIQGRREIYNDVCKAIEAYKISNNNKFELAEGSFFREDKKDLTKLQARKVISNKGEGNWQKPEVLTILCKDNIENRILCRSIQEWFKNNTNTTIKYSVVKEEFEDEELRNRYDMVLINNEANINNKQGFYSNFQEYLTAGQKTLLDKIKANEKKYDYSGLEESLFDNYNVLPLVFSNENIAISNKVSDLKLDGNGNIDFTAFK